MQNTWKTRSVSLGSCLKMFLLMNSETTLSYTSGHVPEPSPCSEEG